jgi:hypothetical protein
VYRIVILSENRRKREDDAKGRDVDEGGKTDKKENKVKEKKHKRK